MKKRQNLLAAAAGIGLLTFLLLLGCKPQIPEGSAGAPKTSPGQPASEPSSKPIEKAATGMGKEEPSQVFAVNTTKAVAGELIDYIELNGDVLTKSTVDIYPDTFGKVSKLLINVGDRIEKDQVIAEIDPSSRG
jgi:multidrug efflux pump subunit AcrA (membrane-fusion protein)